METGGSEGLASSLIRRDGKYVLLTSDVGYLIDSWEKMIVQGVMVNK